ncbi:CCR4-NOT transcription complex subunit 3 [Hordeum vulgare]|nr:CCR4-NOT transcription complex subunit 3 [Hordeum vulgare]
MTASSSSSLWILAPTHHTAAGARPLRLPFHSVSVRPCRSPVSASASPQQTLGLGDDDRANGRTGVPVPVPLSRDVAIELPRPLTSTDLMQEASGESLKVASGPSVRAVPTAISTTAAAVSVLADTISSPGPVRPIIPAAAPTIFAASAAVRNAPESMTTVASTPANLFTAVKDDESMSFPPHRPSPAVTEIGLGRGINCGLTSQALAAPISVSPVPGNGSITPIPAINDLSKRNISNSHERVNSGGLSRQLVSPLGSEIQQQPVLKTNDAVSSDSSNTSESTVLGGRVYSSPVVPGA